MDHPATVACPVVTLTTVDHRLVVVVLFVYRQIGFDKIKSNSVDKERLSVYCLLK